MVYSGLTVTPGSWSTVTSLFSHSHPLFLSAIAQASEPAEPDSSFVLAAVMLSLVVVYLASKVGGELSNRLGFPPVLGELVGGVLVGVSALHLLVFPDTGVDGSSSLIMQILLSTDGLSPEAVNPTFKATGEVISVLSDLGVIILLFEIGLESNLNELMKVGIQAILVAVVGVTVPFVAGTAGAMLIFGVPAIPAIFAGAALTATSIGITSKVLSELNQLTSKEGQIILGAAIADDIIGIVILAVVASLAKTGRVDVGNAIYLIVSSVLFIVGTLLLGKLVNTVFIALSERLKTRGALVVPAMIFALILSYIGAAVHLEAILGAFAAGLLLDETKEREELEELIKPVADLVVPIFFVSVGARTDIGVLNPAISANREGLVIAIFLITVAIVGKVVTGLAVFGQPGINRLAIGVGMIPRGEVGLVFAGVGTASGIISDALNAAIIMMVILTTFLAPPLLRFTFPEPQSEPVQDEGTPAQT
ncbi:cation:proton antiporter [Pseudanabaena sp. PCC 6802]|uniref:cation:proton antiporter n=1 Tax=Pseudanabaena sp. PCC 6802 TaxID=118173 RepID=UPI0003471295|nr:cation:proton antiporter [Pseudanabaena sp. PCC 6802]